MGGEDDSEESGPRPAASRRVARSKGGEEGSKHVERAGSASASMSKKEFASSDQRSHRRVASRPLPASPSASEEDASSGSTGDEVFERDVQALRAKYASLETNQRRLAAKLMELGRLTTSQRGDERGSSEEEEVDFDEEDEEEEEEEDEEVESNDFYLDAEESDEDEEVRPRRGRRRCAARDEGSSSSSNVRFSSSAASKPGAASAAKKASHVSSKSAATSKRAAFLAPDYPVVVVGKRRSAALVEEENAVLRARLAHLESTVRKLGLQQQRQQRQERGRGGSSAITRDELNAFLSQGRRTEAFLTAAAADRRAVRRPAERAVSQVAAITDAKRKKQQEIVRRIQAYDSEFRSLLRSSTGEDAKGVERLTELVAVIEREDRALKRLL